MDQDKQIQFFEQIRKANKILVALPQNLTVDNTASGLALLAFLKKLQKDAELISSGEIAESLKFLPGIESLKKHLSEGPSLVVHVNTAEKTLAEISYQTLPNQTSIYLKAKGHAFTPSDVSFAEEKFPLDLIICLDCASLADLGVMFEQYTDLFYETPKINIDIQADNELYGAVNLVDLSAASVSEILADLFEKYETQVVDEDMATNLLAGIITKTHSFQHALTTPATFLRASGLVSLGGRQQDVIKHFFKTKPLKLLKLWGRALARLKTVNQYSVLYAALNASDYEKSGAVTGDTQQVLKEFLDNMSGYKFFAIIFESEHGLSLCAALHQGLDAGKFLTFLGQHTISDFAGTSYKLVEIASFAENLSQGEEKLLTAISMLPKTENF